MAFEIVELKKETFTGNKVEIPEFDPQKGFGPMSEIKESAHTKFAKNEKDYVGINASLDDLQYYIVASAKGEKRRHYFRHSRRQIRKIRNKRNRPPSSRRLHRRSIRRG